MLPTMPKAILKGIWTAAIILFLAVNLGTAPSPQASSAQPSNRVQRDDTFTPILTTLAIDHYPAPGQSATLICEISTVIDAPGTQARFELPTDARLINGSLTWQGDLLVGHPEQLVATIVFDVPGEKSLFCRALRPIDAENTWGDLAELYLTVGQVNGQAGFAPIPQSQHVHDAVQVRAGDGTPVQNSPQASYHPTYGQGVEPPPALDPKSEEAQASPVPEAPQGSLTVTGHWHYYGRADEVISGEMTVEAIQGDDGSHLAWCNTDMAGSYSCGPFTNPGTAGVRILWYSYVIYAPHGDLLATINPDWGSSNAIKNTYSVKTDIETFADGTHDIGDWCIPNCNTYERAFWVTTDLGRAWRYIWFGTGINQNPQETTGSGTVQWKIDSTDGTYYSWGGNIHLTGTDPLSNTTVDHEYGHNVMYSKYGNWLPFNDCTSPHYIQLASGPHCGWVEGWADFFPLAINNDPVYRWKDGGSLNLETPTWGTLPYWQNGDQVEGRVAGTLWDILDNVNDRDDTYSDPNGIADIWDILYNQKDSTFSYFWASWLSRGHDNSSAGPIMDLYQNTIDYRSGPSNDDFANPASISGAPYFVTGLDTTNATTQGFDPASACGSLATPRQSRSVWYSFTPPGTGDYNLDTLNSNYDTGLALWTGSWGSLSPSACVDNLNDVILQSSITTTLTGGTTYYIEATDWGNDVGGSLDLSVCKVPSPSGLVSPGNGNATNENTPTFTWNAAGGADDYEFILSTHSDLSSPIYEVVTTGLSYTVPAALPDGIYYWNVRGRNHSGGCADFGNWNTTNPLTVDTAAPQTTVTVVPASVVDNVITLNWSAVDPAPGSGVATYDVQYRVGASGAWTDWLVGTTKTSAVFGPLDPVHLVHGQTYYFRVRAYDQAGNVEDYAGGNGDTFTVFANIEAFLPVLRK